MPLCRVFLILGMLHYRLVWAEAKNDPTSVFLDFTYYFLIFLQRNLRTNPIQIL